MSTIDPEPRATIPGSAACARSIGAVSETRSVRSHPSSVAAATGRVSSQNALHTTMSTDPNARTATSTSRAGRSGSARSPATPSAATPRSWQRVVETGCSRSPSGRATPPRRRSAPRSRDRCPRRTGHDRRPACKPSATCHRRRSIRRIFFQRAGGSPNTGSPARSSNERPPGQPTPIPGLSGTRTPIRDQRVGAPHEVVPERNVGAVEFEAEDVAQRRADVGAPSSPSGLAMQWGANGRKLRAARSPIRNVSPMPPAFWTSGVRMWAPRCAIRAANPRRGRCSRPLRSGPGCRGRPRRGRVPAGRGPRTTSGRRRDGLGDGEGGRDVEPPVAIETETDVVADRLASASVCSVNRRRSRRVTPRWALRAGRRRRRGRTSCIENQRRRRRGRGRSPCRGRAAFCFGRFPVEGAVLGVAALGQPEGTTVAHRGGELWSSLPP